MASAQTTTSAAGSRWHPLALVALALTAWVYHPVTRVFFYYDDLVHLKDIVSESTASFLLSPFGGHNYLVRNSAFLASYHLFGVRPNLYYGTALLTHLLNVWLLFGVLRAVTASAMLACFGAALWGTSPLGVGSLAWYSAYGHVLNGMFLLIPLYGLTRRAAVDAPLSAGTAAVWYGLILAGTTCYGVGVGIALAFPLVLFLLMPAAWRRRGLRTAYLALPVVTVLVYFAFRRLYALSHPLSFEETWHEEAALSGFHTAIPVMLGHLLAYAAAATTLGTFVTDRYPDATTWAVVSAFVGGVCLVLWRGDQAARRATVAMALLAGAVYVLIAVGRANLYETFEVSLAQAATTSRYHYAGSIPVVVLLALILRQIGRLPLLRAVPGPVVLGCGLGLVVAGQLAHGVVIDDQHKTHDWFLYTQQEIVAAVAAEPPGATVYIENPPSPKYVLGVLRNELFPGRAGVFVLSHPSDMVDGRRVRFVEHDPDVLAFVGQKPDSRLATLLVRPDDVARAH